MAFRRLAPNNAYEGVSPRFLDFYADLVGNDYDPAKWWTKVTRQFLKSLADDTSVSQATVCRVYASVRRFAHNIN